MAGQRPPGKSRSESGTPPRSASAPSGYAVSYSTGTRTNHGLHFLLAVLTFGLWIPVWIVIAIRNASRRQTVTQFYP